jgi:hypothetical protein
MEFDDPQRRRPRYRQGRFLIPAGSRRGSALGLRRRKVTGSPVTIKISRSNFSEILYQIIVYDIEGSFQDAGRGINFSTRAGIPSHRRSIPEEHEDTDRAIADLHLKRISNWDADPRLGDESNFNNQDLHSMQVCDLVYCSWASSWSNGFHHQIFNTNVMNQITIRELHVRLSTLETQLEHSMGAVGGEKEPSGTGGGEVNGGPWSGVEMIPGLNPMWQGLAEQLGFWSNYSWGRACVDSKSCLYYNLSSIAPKLYPHVLRNAQ